METILMLLLVCSAMTALVTEAIKMMIPQSKEYSKNILAGVVSIVVSVLISIGYIILTHTAVTKEVLVYIVALVVLSWLCSMLGYDKVVQTIRQIGTKQPTSK